MDLLVIGLTILIIYLIYSVSIKYFRKPKSHSVEDAIFITGCDSGIGYSLACHCAEIGATVFAFCLDKNSLGALSLQKLRHVYVIQMDIRHLTSVKEAASAVSTILSKNHHLKMKAFVNNAGVMVFGEFAWFTEDIIEQQVGVNLIGAMRATKAFLPNILRDKARIINICSHCSLEALPGLSVYAASKSGLLAWSNSLRVELKKFEVPVISILPGSFAIETNILAKQQQYAEEMKRNMSKDDWEFYAKYFTDYNSYLCGFELPELHQINNRGFYDIIDNALFNAKPKYHYSNSPSRYKYYHFLFKITPRYIRDWLVIKFMNMPEWKR